MRRPQTIQALNKLIQTCRGGEQLCAASAQYAASATVKVLLRQRAAEWGRHGDELQALVLTLGGSPATTGTAGATLLSAWVCAKAVLLGVSDVLTLEACQHVQLAARHQYESVLGEYLPARIRRTLTLQVDRVAGRAEAVEALLAGPLARSVNG